jgi:3,4-dehydroadipyl-CoA semialdehyde dehydrogenase
MTAPIQLQSYLCDQWQVGSGNVEELFNPSTEEMIATTCTTGLNFDAAFDYARTVGGTALRTMTFAERGELLTKMAAVLHEKREYLLEVSRDCNGATRGDSKFDVDGATGTLSTYGRYGAKMGDEKFQLDGTANRIAANARHMGQHFRLPREGVAFHINAFNFPAWGAFEKIACAFLAGMPVVTKPSSTTALLTYEMIKIIVEADFLPAGTLSFIAGDSADALDKLQAQDVVECCSSRTRCESWWRYLVSILEQCGDRYSSKGGSKVYRISPCFRP